MKSVKRVGRNVNHVITRNFLFSCWVAILFGVTIIPKTGHAADALVVLGDITIMEDCAFMNSPGWGIDAGNTLNTVIRNCQFHHNTLGGITAGSGREAHPGPLVPAVAIRSSWIFANQGPGIWLSSNSSVHGGYLIDHCTIYDNKTGLLVSSPDGKVEVTNTIFMKNLVGM